MLKLILELAEEICVLHDRLDTVQKIVKAGGTPTAEAVDEFEITEAEIERRLARHQAFYEETFRKLSG